MGQRTGADRIGQAPAGGSLRDLAVPRRGDLARRRKLIPYYFVAPAVIFVFVGTVFMSLYALYISFTDYQLTSTYPRRFVGVDNYLEAIRDGQLWRSVWQTVTIAAPALVLELLVGLALALLMNRSFRGRAVAISLLVTPVMVSSAAAGMAFRLLFEPRYGPINDVLSRLTGRTVAIEWLGSHSWARPAIVLTDVWHMSPFVMLLLLAGLTNISDEIYGAARVDGADGWRMLIDIILPLLKPILVLIVLLRGIDLASIFDLIFIMTKGGPGTVTQTLSYYLYINGLQFFRIGYAAAMAWLVAIFFIIFAKYYLDLLRKEQR